MTLGISRPRNWGKECQEAALAIVLKDRRCTYRVKQSWLQVAPSHNGITLPFTSIASLCNPRRGRWEARSLWDDSIIATGISERDVVAKTIAARWN